MQDDLELGRQWLADEGDEVVLVREGPINRVELDAELRDGELALVRPVVAVGFEPSAEGLGGDVPDLSRPAFGAVGPATEHGTQGFGVTARRGRELVVEFPTHCSWNT